MMEHIHIQSVYTFGSEQLYGDDSMQFDIFSKKSNIPIHLGRS